MLAQCEPMCSHCVTTVTIEPEWCPLRTTVVLAKKVIGTYGCLAALPALHILIIVAPACIAALPATYVFSLLLRLRAERQGSEAVEVPGLLRRQARGALFLPRGRHAGLHQAGAGAKGLVCGVDRADSKPDCCVQLQTPLHRCSFFKRLT